MMDGCNTNGDIIRTYIIDDYSDNLAFSCSTGTMWHIPSGTTLGVCPNHQYFIYGDMLIEGELQLSGNSQLVVLNGNINLSGGTITGTGNAYNIFLPLTDTKISGLTYNGSVLTIYQTDGTNFSTNIAFTGNTSGSCITNLYVQNLNSCSPLHIQPINNGDVYISESGGNVGIGTTNPLSTLDVNGKITTTNFQMTSGATNGYVLTSDGSGNAYWTPPFVDTYVTGFTYDSSNNLTISQNQGQLDLTVTLPPYITGFTDYYVTGGTYSNGTLTLERQDSSFTIPGFLTGTTDTYTTGFTYSNNNLIIGQNEGQPDLVVNIDVMSGLTINGSLSATTYLGLPIDPDNYVTGGTYSNGTLTLDRQNGSLSISGFLSADTYVTGFTFNTGTYDLTILQNNGLPSLTQNLGILAGDITVTGGTYNPSNGVATFYNNIGGSFQVSGFLTGFTDVYLTSGSFNPNNGDLTLTRTDNVNVVVTGFTDYYVTGGTYSGGTLTLNRQNGSVSINGLKFTGNTSGDCISDLYVTNLSSCSPLHIQPINTGNVLIGENGGVNVGIGTLTPNATLDIKSPNDFIGSYGIRWFNSGSTRGLNIDNDGSLYLNGRQTINWANNNSFTALDIIAQTGQILNVQGSGSGTVCIGPGVADSNTKLHIKGIDSSSSNYGLKVQNSGGTNNLVVRNDGIVSGDGIGGNSFQLGSYSNSIEGDLTVGRVERDTNTTFSIYGANYPRLYFDSVYSTKISLTSGAGGQYLLLSDNANPKFTWLSSTNIGINLPSTASTINAELEVNGKTKTETLQITSGSTNGYILISDSNGNAIWSSPSTLTGLSTTDYYVTGGTYSNGTLTLDRQNGSINVTGFSQYFISGSTPTGTTINYGDRWYNTNNGIELVYINDGSNDLWVQPSSPPGPPGYSNLMITSSITTSAATLNININYYGVNHNGNVDISLPNPSGYDGYNINIKDESGNASIYRIRLTPLSGLIDGNNYVDMNINYMSLHIVARNNNWWII